MSKRDSTHIVVRLASCSDAATVRRISREAYTRACAPASLTGLWCVSAWDGIGAEGN